MGTLGIVLFQILASLTCIFFLCECLFCFCAITVNLQYIYIYILLRCQGIRNLLSNPNTSKVKKAVIMIFWVIFFYNRWSINCVSREFRLYYSQKRKLFAFCTHNKSIEWSTPPNLFLCIFWWPFFSPFYQHFKLVYLSDVKMWYTSYTEIILVQAS